MRNILTAILLGFCLVGFGQVMKVEIRQEGDQWQMYRDGEPYYVKGVGGQTRMDVAVEIGANSIRTWGIDNAQAVLDEAQEKGLSVMLGIWLPHERHGFDYSDPWAVEDQVRHCERVVKQFKDHPALLLWGVGNEMDLFYTDFNVWDCVERIAAMMHREDPNHPTCVVTAGIDVAEIQMIQERAPSIDIMGINTYGDIHGLNDKIDLYGWEGPYLVTEWGPNGHWEVDKTEWGAPIEQSSEEKAMVYKNRYSSCIAADTEQCLGSYLFLWGNKQETTSTWYGVFLPDGSQTQAIDEMHKIWRGTDRSNRAPVVSKFMIGGKGKESSVTLGKGQSVEVQLDVVDPDGDSIEYTWQVVPESTFTKSGGDVEQKPEPLAGKFVSENNGSRVFKAPRGKGAYRLFMFAHDGKGHAATANIPFLVE